MLEEEKRLEKEIEILEYLKKEKNREKIKEGLKEEIEELLKKEKDIKFSKLEEICYEKIKLDEEQLKIIKNRQNDKINREIKFIINGLFNEDLEIIIKRYPRMAIEKSLILRIYHKLLSEIENNEKFEESLYYRGRLFDKGKSPFCNEEPYMELVQPPEDYAGKQRYSEEKQSRFYIMNKKIGTYFECRKYEKENKEKDLYVQEFEMIDTNLNVVKLDSINGELFYPTPSTIIEATLEKIKEVSYDRNYEITNYIADIINATSKKHGISYESVILYNENNLFNDINFEIYRNFVLFFDVWDKDKYKRGLTEYKKDEFEKYFKTGTKLEAKNYFKPIKIFPEKLEPKDVILEFFSEENMNLVNSGLVKSFGKYDVKISIEVNFQELFKNLNKEVNNIRNIMCLEYNDKEDKKFLEDYYTKKFKEHLYKITDINNKTEIDFSEYNIFKDILIDNFYKIADYKIQIRKEDEKYIVEKVEFSNGFHKEITDKIMNVFHYYFGIYYRIIIDYERDKIGLFEV